MEILCLSGDLSTDYQNCNANSCGNIVLCPMYTKFEPQTEALL